MTNASTLLMVYVPLFEAVPTTVTVSPITQPSVIKEPVAPFILFAVSVAVVEISLNCNSVAADAVKTVAVTVVRVSVNLLL
jgi:hypothetical protein